MGKQGSDNTSHNSQWSINWLSAETSPAEQFPEHARLVVLTGAKAFELTPDISWKWISDNSVELLTVWDSADQSDVRSLLPFSRDYRYYHWKSRREARAVEFSIGKNIDFLHRQLKSRCDNVECSIELSSSIWISDLHSSLFNTKLAVTTNRLCTSTVEHRQDTLSGYIYRSIYYRSIAIQAFPFLATQHPWRKSSAIIGCQRWPRTTSVETPLRNILSVLRLLPSKMLRPSNSSLPSRTLIHLLQRYVHSVYCLAWHFPDYIYHTMRSLWWGLI
jgi:hypothetical protein